MNGNKTLETSLQVIQVCKSMSVPVGLEQGSVLLNVASSRAPEGQTFEVASQPVGDVHDLYRGKHMDHMANRSDRNCCFFFWD